MMLGQRDLRAKASMQCLFGLVNEPYFNLFFSIGFNFKVVILGAWGLRPTYRLPAAGEEKIPAQDPKSAETDSC